MRAVRHLGCRKWKLLLLPRVRPSGITRGYAWCVPTGDIIIAFENTIRLSVHILIASAHALIAFEVRIRLSAHTLIAPKNPIRIRPHILIASTLPSDIAFSPTVPSGDTPCLTAGDARRANPWTDESTNLRRRRCRTAASLLHV